MPEKIITNKITGGKKGQKEERYSLIPWEQLDEVTRVYTFGSQKYDNWNWTKGYDWSLSYDSLIRHARAFWSGESKDPESGLSHLAHAIFHCFALMYFEKNHADLDDRFTTISKEESSNEEQLLAIPDYKYQIGDLVRAPEPTGSNSILEIEGYSRSFISNKGYNVINTSNNNHGIVYEDEIIEVNGVPV